MHGWGSEQGWGLALAFWVCITTAGIYLGRGRGWLTPQGNTLRVLGVLGHRAEGLDGAGLTMLPLPESGGFLKMHTHTHTPQITVDQLKTLVLLAESLPPLLQTFWYA